MKSFLKSTSPANLLLVLLGLFFSILSANAQAPQDEQRVYIKIEIFGLACPYCAYGMEQDLLQLAGVEEVDIQLKEGLAYISTPVEQKPDKKEIAKVVEDGGFTVGKIEYSDKPFE